MENPAAGASAESRKTLTSFLALRMIVSAFVLGAGIMIIQATNESFPVGPLYLLLVFSLATGAAAYAATRWNLSPTHVLWSVVVSDILLEASILHFSGGTGSQFSLIFCLTIVAAAFLLEMAGGLGAATMASLCFVLYGVLERMGVLEPPGLGHLGAANKVGLLETYMHVSIFFMVGAVGGFLARRIREKGRELSVAESELKQLKIDTDQILNNMSSGIVVADSTGEVVSINPAAEEILGVKRDDVLLRMIDDTLAGAAPELVGELREALISERNRYRREITIRRDTEDAIPLGTSISLLRDRDGAPRGVISVFQDLTEVQEMRDKVRRADRLAAIGELSAGIAHELRNPLASISGSIEMLVGELELDGENKRLMELILRESDRLNRIIEDFLEFARLRQPSRRRISIGACLEEVGMLLRNNPVARKVTIHVAAPEQDLEVSADDEQLRQVFLNLAINSCEAMRAGGSLEIQVTTGDGVVRIRFRDDGPGIAAKDRERLFEPFFTTKEGGTGLGLAIANRIIEAHGGSIEFENSQTGGATFCIILPQTPMQSTPTDFVSSVVSSGVNTS